VALTFAALSLIGATLTLPGHRRHRAGRSGSRVDANVLINERIREETRKGKGAAAALDAGFTRALLDHRPISNVTALIATGLAVFWFGSGPVAAGFAVTMGARHRPSRMFTCGLGGQGDHGRAGLRWRRAASSS